MNPCDITVIGAGLAGCEASWRLAQAGLHVRLVEQKPQHRTPAQRSDYLAELVCSNSFRSTNPHNAVGLLKEELERAGSLLMAQAVRHRVPAGDALAVDREHFGQAMTDAMRNHPRITLVSERISALPAAEGGPCIVATGPLTADALAKDIARATGDAGLYFYDAIAPILSGASLDREVVFAASRWDKGLGADYLNCPLTEQQYGALIDFLLTAECYPTHAFEQPKYFSGCQPIEVLAKSGRESLRFGPLKPVGLTDPRTGRWPHAVVQLRAEDQGHQAYNLVGLQTKLKHGEQRRLLEHIPGLGKAQILRYGALHRNTYLDSPTLLDDQLRLRSLPHLLFAGQITGVEGYVESAACGLLVAALFLQGRAGAKCVPPPPETALGALYQHIRGTARLAGRAHEPQNINWGLVSPLQPIAGGRRDKKADQARRTERARAAFAEWQGAHLPTPAADRAQTGAAASPASRSQLEDSLGQFAEHLLAEGRVSEATVVAYRSDLALLFAAAVQQGRHDLAAIDVTFLRSALAAFTDRRGEPLSPRSIGRKHSALRAFFAWVVAAYDPAVKDPTPYLISPPQPRGVPEPLQVPAALALMQGKPEADGELGRLGADEANGRAGHLRATSAQGERPSGADAPPLYASYTQARDVAALLLLYGPGLRRQEVLDLKLCNVDLAGRWLQVEGRGRQARRVPIPIGCIEGLTAYLAVRVASTNGYFLAGRGDGPLAARTLARIVGRAATALVGRHATPHQLRHSFATHLLQDGASLQHIQQLLGHSQLATTVRYQQVASDQLAKAHKLAHPREVAFNLPGQAPRSQERRRPAPQPPPTAAANSAPTNAGS